MLEAGEITISVVIPCYNCESTIYRAVQSIFLSKKLPCEILLYDDCSDDGTRDLLKKISKEFDTVTVFFSDVNKGAGYARNFLIDISCGDYIAFLDADDRWLPGKLDETVAVIQAENADIITSFYDIEDEVSRKVGSRSLPTKINLLRMHLSNWLPMSMTVVRSCLIGVNEMPLIRRRQDYAFWLNIFKKNANLKCHVIAEPLGVYTRRKDSLSSSPLTNLKCNYEMFRKAIGYNALVSAFLVSINSLFRIFRV